MLTNVLTVDEAISMGNYSWKKGKNDCSFKGIVPGYICGWCVEAEKNGEIKYCSMTCTNDYEEIKLPSMDYNVEWNDLGISADMAMMNGWVPTGNIVFRGYYEERYDPYEREEYVVDKSAEVMALFDKYCVA